MTPTRVPIPESLHSTETGEPISTCLVCDKPLLDDSTEYLIEKGVRQYESYDVQETIFGYALCMDCHVTLQQAFSDRSRQRCQTYLASHIDAHDRATSLLEGEDFSPNDWIRQCAIHDTPRENLREFQVLAHCQGEKMLLSHLPLLIGGTAVDELTQLLSDETIDDLGGFRDEYFGLPPELKQNVQGPVLA